MLQLHPTNRNAGYSCVGSVCMSVILVPDQQPSHYCHRVSRHLYHFHVWLSTNVWNLDSRPAVIYVTASRDYQACCSTHVFKLCSETAGMFVTVAPGHLTHRIQVCISVRFANKFVVVGCASRFVCYTCLRPAAMTTMLVPDQWAVKHNCTGPSGMYVTVAPDQQSCLYMLHTISMRVSYSFILSASMNVIFAPSHQPCL